MNDHYRITFQHLRVPRESFILRFETCGLPRYVLQPDNQFFIKLHKQDNVYYREVTDKFGEVKTELRVVNLSPAEKIDNKFTLHEIVDAIQKGNIAQLDQLFKIDVQAALGSYLYEILFKDWLDRQPGRRISTQVRMIIDDPFLIQIPWVLFADNKKFLASYEWQISRSPFHPHGYQTFEPFPKILMALPEPTHLPSTGRSAHLTEMTAILKAIASHMADVPYLHLVYNWNEFKAKLLEIEPQVVYYYGHGEYKDGVSYLLWEKGADRRLDSAPIVDLPKIIHKLKKTTPDYLFKLLFRRYGRLVGSG